MAAEEYLSSSRTPDRELSRAEHGPLPLGLLIALRPKQWTKNGLLFIGLIFSRNLADQTLILTCLEGFILFCALASGIYLVNDLADLQKDRSHPRKRLRPIASGWVSPRLAATTATLLLGLGIPAGFLINMPFGLLGLGYVVLTLAYTFVLKHMVIMDVFSLAAGFVVRAVAGGVAIAVPISPWLYVCTVLGALFLGISKRRHELVLLNGNANSHRPILQEYTPLLLEQMNSVVTSALVMAYSLYTFSAPNLPQSHAMMLTIPFVLYGIFRYLYLIHIKDEGGSPEELLLKDRPLLVDAILWVLASVAILYLAD